MMHLHLISTTFRDRLVCYPFRISRRSTFQPLITRPRTPEAEVVSKSYCLTPAMSPTPIYIVTTSQTPLPIRFPRPRKPILLLPPLIHRALHSALDARPPSAIASSSGIIIPHPESLVKHDVPSRAFPSQMTPRSDTSSPSADPDETDDIDAEVTVKLHLVGRAPTSTRAGWVTESLAFLARYKGLGSVDNLLIGFNGVDYKGRKTAASEMFGCGTEGLEGGSGSDVVDEETERGMRGVWDEVSRGGGGVGGRVGRMGTMYLPLGLLRALSEAEVAPRINAMDTPDCQSLPKEYSGFAREKGIELWAGGGGEGAGEGFLCFPHFLSLIADLCPL